MHVSCLCHAAMHQSKKNKGSTMPRACPSLKEVGTCARLIQESCYPYGSSRADVYVSPGSFVVGLKVCPGEIDWMIFMPYS